MLVASTILRVPGGGTLKAWRCSDGEMLECRGMSQRMAVREAAVAESRSSMAVISPMPA